MRLHFCFDSPHQRGGFCEVVTMGETGIVVRYASGIYEFVSEDRIRWVL